MAAKKKTTKAPKKTRSSKRRSGSMGSNMTPAAKKKVLQAIIAQTNKAVGHQAIQRANELDSSYLLRRPTGIMSLDLELIGGFPAGAPVVICGEDGAGKDYLLWRMAAEVQRIYGKDFAMAVYLTEFRADKPFMKDICGLQIGFTDNEIHEISVSRKKAGLVPLTKEQVAHYKNQVGEIIIIEGIAADDGFDAILDFVSSNTCQIVAVNSIGSLQTAAKDKAETLKDFGQQSSEAALMSKFMPQLSLLLSQTLEGGERNETSVVLINQMRSDRNAKKGKGPMAKAGPSTRPALNSWSLNHGKAIELQLEKSTRIYDEELKIYLGRKTRWKITKGKLGTHDGISGEYDFYYDGGADWLGDLIGQCRYYEVITLAGSYYSFDHPEFGFKSVQGAPKLTKLLKSSQGLLDALRRECLRAAGKTYRHK